MEKTSAAEAKAEEKPLLGGDAPSLLADLSDAALVSRFKAWMSDHGFDWEDALREEPTQASAIPETPTARAKRAKEFGDLESFFRELAELRAQHGSPFPSGFEIRFKDLSVSVTEKIDEERISTVGNTLLQPLQRMMHPPQKVERHLLRGISGILKPGRLTLLLGPPGCGKTLFMKALSGKLSRSQLSVGGTILYNGHEANDTEAFVLSKSVAYIQQQDSHLSTLTVRQTFEFAWKALVGVDGEDFGDVKEQLEQDIGSKVDNILRLLGLEGCADTIVGNELLRGVSGGQKRRVGTGEMLMGQFGAFLADEISTGLDAATTFDEIFMIRIATRVFNLTTLVSLLQPTPEVVELFDDVMLLDHGQVVYHGPREGIEAHFENLGYRRPHLKDLADYLQEVTTTDGSAFFDPGASVQSAPRTSEDFVSCWKETDASKAMDAELSEAPEKGTFAPSLQVEFSNSWLDDFKLCLNRQVALTMGDIKTAQTRIIQQIVVGALVAGLFADLDQDAFQSKYGVIFVAIINFSLTAMLTLSARFEQRAVFYKQRDASFFRTSTYVIATTVVGLPQQIIEVVVWSCIVYFSVGLSDDNGGQHFLIFIATLILVSITMEQVFQILVATLPSAEVAQPVASAVIVVLVLFSGYVIAEDNLDDWFVWLYYLDPVAWAFIILAQNEFDSETYDGEVDLGSGRTIREGDLALEDQGLETDGARTNIGVLVLLAYLLLTFFGASCAFHSMRFEPPHSSGEEEEERETVLAKSKISPGPYTGMSFRQKVESGDGMTSRLPFERTDLSWQDLSYSVTVGSDTQLELLHNVSGYAKSGSCTALMGSSGAGKTTLMDVIAGRKTGGKVTGKIFVNGYELDKQSFSRIIGYCEQMDIHMKTMTVMESLRFSARLRLPADTVDEDIFHFLNDILSSLDLTHLQDAQVVGLSQEQLKRLTIGVELCANPGVLFLDEPTSGLDSRAAALVMKTIKQAARSGRAVVATIHQPSQAVFAQFDQLLLLMRGGRTVYFGGLGDDGIAIVDYFRSQPGVAPYKSGTNPAVYMLDCVGAGTSGSSVTDYHQVWIGSTHRSVLDEQLLRPGLSVPGERAKIEFEELYAASYAVQLKMCMWRAAINYYRSPQYNVTRISIGAFVALLFGSVYWQQDYDDFSNAYSRVSLIFMTTLFLGIVCYVSAISPFHEQRAVFYRERAANMYEVSSYVGSIGIVEIPYLVVTAFVFTVIYYFTVGFQDEADLFFEYYVLIFLWITIMTFFGQALVAIFPTMPATMAVGSGLVQIFNLFAGFMQPVDEIPEQLIMLYWASPLHYVFEGLVTSQFRDDDTKVTRTIVGEGTVVVEMSDLIDDLYSEFDYDHWDYIIGVLIAFIVVFRLTTFLALTYINHLTR